MKKLRANQSPDQPAVATCVQLPRLAWPRILVCFGSAHGSVTNSRLSLAQVVGVKHKAQLANKNLYDDLCPTRNLAIVVFYVPFEQCSIRNI